MPTPDLDATRTGLLVFDMLECYRDAAEEAGAIEPVARLISGCRAAGVAILYARADHRPDGADLARAPTDTDRAFRPWTDEHQPATRPPNASGSPGVQVLAELAPEPGDYDIRKHRWNAFFQTPLELSLRTRGIRSVLIVGGSTHVGVASTVFAGRDMDFDMVVVRDGCTGFAEQRLFFLDRVFPRMCRVRTVDQVLAALAPAPAVAGGAQRQTGSNAAAGARRPSLDSGAAAGEAQRTPGSGVAHGAEPPPRSGSPA